MEEASRNSSFLIYHPGAMQKGSITSIGNYPIPYLEFDRAQTVPINWKKLLIESLVVFAIVFTLVAIWKVYVKP